MDFTWKIGGEAGFGIMTTGLMFSKIAARLGYHIFDYIKYPSLIRGGHNTYEIRISNEPVTMLKYSVDLLICLNQETFEKNRTFLTSESCVIYDEQDFTPDGNFVKINVPFNKILADLKGQMIMKNTIVLGASLALVGGDLSILDDLINEQFEKKGEEVIKFNQQFADKGYQFVKENYAGKLKKWLVKKENENQLVMTGNEAFSLGTVIADCRMYVAYPMTPSSGVLTVLASWQEKTKMIVRHAEDEIAVINTAIGSSFAGARSAVGTSGGGYALMAETVSLAGITETPIVVFIAQRPGPATGMPTWTEQGDLLFTVHSGHGEFPKIILAPGDIEEMIKMTVEAFDLADIYQTPVIVLSDMLLSENHKSLPEKFVKDLIADYKINRGKVVSGSNLKSQNSNSELKTQSFLRYKLTEDGISERLIPGTKGYYYQANSYEHLEDGHTTEEATIRVQQVDKRARKMDIYLKKDFVLPEVYGDLEKAETIFVGWGSIKGAIIEARKLLLKQGKETAFIHFTHIYPLDEDKVRAMFKPEKKYVLIENNSTGQFGKLLRQECGIEIKDKLLKYDGRPIWPDEIVSKLT